MNSKQIRGLAIASGALVLGACTVLPTGPSVMVLPGNGQSLEHFRDDDGYCRQFALDSIGGKTANDAARESALTTAAVVTAVGAAAGAAMGGHESAAMGAGAGLLMGTATGTGTSNTSRVGTQRSYDNAYVQCMYVKGHRVPVPSSMAYSRTVSRSPDTAIPPPPPGSPPPPPQE